MGIFKFTSVDCWIFIIATSLLFALFLLFFFKRNNKSLTNNPLPDKDPLDWTKTASSTNWLTDDHWCSNCKATTNHNEYMAEVCNNCGNQAFQKRFRPWRKIILNGKWVYQYKYGNDKYEIEDHRL